MNNPVAKLSKSAVMISPIVKGVPKVLKPFVNKSLKVNAILPSTMKVKVLPQNCPACQYNTCLWRFFRMKVSAEAVL